MNPRVVDRVVESVLYEGYVLYPYRPSVKNRHRWTFGGLYPADFSSVRSGSDLARSRLECLVRGTPDAVLDVAIRFLHLIDRVVHAADAGLPDVRPVDALAIGDRTYCSWQEAEERRLDLPPATIGDLLGAPRRHSLSLPARQRSETLTDAAGATVGTVERRKLGLEIGVVLSAVELEPAGAADGDRLFRARLEVVNETPLPEAFANDRDQAVLRSLASTNFVLTAKGGRFVSLIDPPEDCRDAAAGCRNVGVWPVLVGEPGDVDAILAAPIILDDYPRVAPESPGDLFDGAEIDEILTLRILTLTPEERRAADAVDDRVRSLLRRTDALTPEQLASLHGTFRPVDLPEATR